MVKGHRASFQELPAANINNNCKGYNITIKVYCMSIVILYFKDTGEKRGKRMPANVGRQTGLEN